MTAKSEVVNKASVPRQPATVAVKPKPIKLADLDILHGKFRIGKDVAEYLGYTYRGYLSIRSRLKKGQALNSRTEAFIRYKLSQLEVDTTNINKESRQ